MNTLTRFDAAALAQLNRALIGFDRIFNETRYQNTNTNYPPYNIIKYNDNSFEIELAVAGFNREDLTIEVDQDELIIKGERPKEENQERYVYRGLANRDFERVFTLEAHMLVGEAELTNGILRVKINRVIPEELKPRLITIK